MVGGASQIVCGGLGCPVLSRKDLGAMDLGEILSSVATGTTLGTGRAGTIWISGCDSKSFILSGELDKAIKHYGVPMPLISLRSASEDLFPPEGAPQATGVFHS